MKESMLVVEDNEKKQKHILERTWVIAILAVMCNALWGSAFPAIKIGYQLFQIDSMAANTQILFAGCRFALAGVMVILFGSLSSKRWLVPRKESCKRIAILSFFQTILQYICFYIGLAHTPGVKASILEGVNVFVAIFIAVFLFHQEHLNAQKIVGSAIGFVGILLVNLNGVDLEMTFHLNGEAMIVLSTVAYGMSSAIIKIFGQKDNSVMLSGYQFLFGGLVMMMVGGLTGGTISNVTIQGIGLLLYLAFVSAAAYTVWALLLRYNPVSKIAIYGFSNPIFGAILSAIILNESGQHFGAKEIVALICVSIGILIVQKQGKQRK